MNTGIAMWTRVVLSRAVLVSAMTHTMQPALTGAYSAMRMVHQIKSEMPDSVSASVQ
jgi:hypothetical protein